MSGAPRKPKVVAYWHRRYSDEYRLSLDEEGRPVIDMMTPDGWSRVDAYDDECVAVMSAAISRLLAEDADSLIASLQRVGVLMGYNLGELK